jgi:DNA-binding GntR family transcriptional regulator
MSKDQSLKEYVYNSVLEEIFSTELKSGDIISEKSLIEKYHCSKSPVREALLTLVVEGVLRSIPRLGYEVVTITPKNIKDMIQFRKMLEMAYMKDNYLKLKPENMEELRKIDSLCTKYRSDIRAHWEYNMLFHQTLMDFFGNEYASATLKKCLISLKRAYAQAYWDKKDVDLSMDTRHHELIIQALENKDIDNACMNLELDLEDFGMATS